MTKHLCASDIMSHPVVAVRESDPIPDVVRTMRRHAISGLPVLDAFGLMSGVITEADILTKEAGPGGLAALDYIARITHRAPDAWAKQAGRTAAEVMTRPVITAEEATPVHELARMMQRGGVNRVPIMRGEDLVGIVTRADIISIFDRSPSVILADVRTALGDQLRMDPDGFEIVVVNGVVRIRGRGLSDADVRLVETFVREVDGVTAVDVTTFNERPSMTA